MRILRMLASDVGQTGVTITEVYNKLLLSKLVTANDLKSRAFYITEVVVKFRKHYNLFRQVRLEHMISEKWEGEWDLDLGFKKTPCRDILEVIVKIATKMTVTEAREGLLTAGWKPGQKPTKNHFEYVRDYVLPSIVAGSGIPKSTGKLAISAPGESAREVAIRGAIGGSGEPTCELAVDASGKSLHESFARLRESRESAVLNAPGNLDNVRERGPGEPSAVPTASNVLPSSNILPLSNVLPTIPPASAIPPASTVSPASTVPQASAASPEAHQSESSAAPPLTSRGLPLGAGEIPEVLKGLSYTTICIRQTLSEFENHASRRTPVDTTDSEWNQLNLTLGNVLMLSSDRYILAVKLDPIGEDQTTPMSHAFERLRRVWARKRKVNAKESRATRRTRPARPAPSRILTKMRRTIRRPHPYATAKRSRLDEREAVVTNSLPPPPASDHRHHDYIAMKGSYGHSRCGVFHLCYWIPTGQEPNGPCLSAHIQSGSYRADAVGKFLRACQTFQKTATDVSVSFPCVKSHNPCANVDVLQALQAVAPEVASKYKAATDKVREWSEGFSLFGKDTCFFGMAVVHNLQVGLHYDGGDDKHGFVVMTPFGRFSGGHLILGGNGEYYKLDYRPGSICIFRSSLVPHAITRFTGTRTAVVLFTKDDALKWVQTHDEPPMPYEEDAGLMTDPDESL